MEMNYGLNYDSMEITDDTVLEYDDIEFKSNKTLQQYYFLDIGFDAYEKIVYYDMFSGLRVPKEELEGFVHMDKSIVLEEEKSYRVGDLKTLYNTIIEKKVNHTFN